MLLNDKSLSSQCLSVRKNNPITQSLTEFREKLETRKVDVDVMALVADLGSALTFFIDDRRWRV